MMTKDKEFEEKLEVFLHGCKELMGLQDPDLPMAEKCFRAGYEAAKLTIYSADSNETELSALKQHPEEFKNLMNSIFIGALEGGSNYWCDLDEADVEDVRTVMKEKHGVSCCMSLAEKIVFGVLVYDLRVAVWDAEDKTECIGMISRQNILERYNKIMDNKSLGEKSTEVDPYIINCFNNFIEEVDDADDADVVFQYLVLGDVIYS